ncbi:MAG: AAA family ATPase [Magnetovibrio sp.]|nr:AAA family ATPase [Magnetovibrio sp.]
MHNSNTPNPSISSVSVSGYKGVRDKRTIEFRNMTLLSGRNGVGKSSLMQPLLLLRQTLMTIGVIGRSLNWTGPLVDYDRGQDFFSVLESDAANVEGEEEYLMELEVTLEDGASAAFKYRLANEEYPEGKYFFANIDETIYSSGNWKCTVKNKNRDCVETRAICGDKDCELRVNCTFGNEKVARDYDDSFSSFNTRPFLGNVHDESRGVWSEKDPHGAKRAKITNDIIQAVIQLSYIPADRGAGLGMERPAFFSNVGVPIFTHSYDHYVGWQINRWSKSESKDVNVEEIGNMLQPFFGVNGLSAKQNPFRNQLYTVLVGNSQES